DEMEDGMKERKEAKHSPESDGFVPTCNLPDRSDSQGHHQKSQRPQSGCISNIFEWICAQPAVDGCPGKQGHRQQAGYENYRLEGPVVIEVRFCRRSSCERPIL